MSHLMPLLVLMAVVSPNPVQAIEMTSGPEAPTLRITGTRSWGPIQVSREGEDLVLHLREATYRVPRPLVTLPPVRWGRFVNNGTGLTLYLRVAPDAPYKISQSGAQLQVQFAPTFVVAAASPVPSPSPRAADPPQAAPSPSPPAGPAPPVSELYGRIFPVPTGGGGTGTRAQPADGRPADDAQSAGGRQQELDSGFLLGPAVLRPSIASNYIDASTEFNAAEDRVEDRYFQFEPRLRLDAPIRMAELEADYVARIRTGAREDLHGITHVLDAALRTPIGPRMVLLLNDQFRSGIADTSEVDPGRELPYRVIDFRSNQLEGNLRVEATARLGAEIGGGLRSVRHDSTSGEITYGVHSGYGRLIWMLTPSLDMRVGYAFDRVPFEAERPYLETRNDSASLMLIGEVIPLLRMELHANYQDRRVMNASSGGERYLGWVFSGRITKELTPSTNIQLSGHRSTPVSSFEQNAFFVSNSINASLNLGLPTGLAMRASAGYYKNDYPTIASELGAPRQDRTPNWSVGLGRPFGRRFYVRADYSEFRRNSNLDRLDLRTHSLSVQLGFGLFGTNVVNQP